jgi:dihydroorotase-like cyclic amidohydrolase
MYACLLCAGMETGTAAAAAGGSTTVVDMPLNSHPCTTNAQLLKEKMKIAEVCRTPLGCQHWRAGKMMHAGPTCTLRN